MNIIVFQNNKISFSEVELTGANVFKVVPGYNPTDKERFFSDCYSFDRNTETISLVDKARETQLKDIGKTIKREEIKRIVQTKIDEVAVSHEFDNAVSLTGYASFENTWKKLATQFSVWRAGCWDKMKANEAANPLSWSTVIKEEDVLAVLDEFVYDDKAA